MLVGNNFEKKTNNPSEEKNTKISQKSHDLQSTQWSNGYFFLTVPVSVPELIKVFWRFWVWF